MTKTFSRADNSILSRWWWSVDRWTFFMVLVLMGIGLILTMAASPAVANKIHLDTYYFIRRHGAYLLIFLSVMISVSLLDQKLLRRFALFLYIFTTLLLVLTPMIGFEVKGARRWINILGISLQPSELIKPALVIITAWMLTEKKKKPDIPGNIFALIFYAVAVFLLLLQPDMGMVVLISAIFFVQFFLAGLPILLIIATSVLGIGGLVSAYFAFPHVHQRIDRFLFPDMADKYTDRYQISQSLDAFANGGLWGQGPGEGSVKKHLPDAHADFIFAVAGEEFGLILCLLIVALFGFIVVRSLFRVIHNQDYFVLLAVAGLALEIGLQAAINMASTIDLIPTKGMTLPYISFGGSSILSVAITTGMLLSLTKRKARGFA
jgi:cell division protein FtsW